MAKSMEQPRQAPVEILLPEPRSTMIEREARPRIRGWWHGGALTPTIRLLAYSRIGSALEARLRSQHPMDHYLEVLNGVGVDGV